MSLVRAGAATVDFTPPPGLLLAGYAARTEPALGAHDPLTARALVIGDTALVVADVIGIHQATSARIRQRCGLPPDNVVVAATHTHAAPVSMPGRLGAPAEPGFVAALEDACVAAIRQAVASAVPCRLAAGMGADPDIARNRRHADGPLDRSLPVLTATDEAGRVVAVLVSYACHPVVLGADNRQMSADFPWALRDEIERVHPGAIAIFANGCAGDVNDGHAASASFTAEALPNRDFAHAERLGRRIAAVALSAPLRPVTIRPIARNALVTLAYDRPEGDLLARAAEWQAEVDAGVPPPRALLLPYWIAWARDNAAIPTGTSESRVTVLDWGDVVIAAMPGEVFSETGLAVRAACAPRTAFVLAYADDTAGYLPASAEYPFGGYEVDEAHRFYGTSGRFAPGSAETLADTVKTLLD
jgi:neutral ceramidase